MGIRWGCLHVASHLCVETGGLENEKEAVKGVHTHRDLMLPGEDPNVPLEILKNESH